MKNPKTISLAVLFSILLASQIGIIAWADDEVVEQNPQSPDTVQEQEL